MISFESSVFPLMLTVVHEKEGGREEGGKDVQVSW